MLVNKRWAELFSIMTEDDSGHVRVADEILLGEMFVEEFFTKLLVFQERMEMRIEQANKHK